MTPKAGAQSSTSLSSMHPLSLILLESTIQQKNLLTATTQPLSSSQASSLPSQHLLICHYWRLSLAQWPGFTKSRVLFNAATQLPKASRACGNHNKKKLSKQSAVLLTRSQTLQKWHLLNQTVSNSFCSHCLTAVVRKTKQSPQLK